MTQKEILTQREIIIALLDGKKIIHKEDSPNGFAQYIHLVGDTLIDQYNETVSIPFNCLKDYEIYIETVSFFEALEAMKEGKICNRLDSDNPIYINKVGFLVYCEDKIYPVGKSDLDAKWIILEDD